MVKVKLYSIITFHWLFIMLLIAVYLLSFWIAKFKAIFFMLVGFSALTWIPSKDCPLLIWENNLRKKIEDNFRPRRFFYLMQSIENLLKIRLPRYITAYSVLGLVILRLAL